MRSLSVQFSFTVHSFCYFQLSSCSCRQHRLVSYPTCCFPV